MDTPLTPQDPTNVPPEPVLPPAEPAPLAIPPIKEGVKIPAPATPSAHVDLAKILLPKKEDAGHTVDSAQRVNAGALLEQEVAAAAEGTHAQDTPAEKLAAIPVPKEAPPADESMVRPLETFQRDIESVVQHDNVSVLSIATAEAERRSSSGLDKTDPIEVSAKRRSLVKNAAMITGALIFLVGASGALAYLLNRATPLPAATTASTASAPFIEVDAQKEITITPDETRDQVMANLNAAKQATSLSLGLMSQLLVTEGSSTPAGEVVAPLSAPDFFTLLAPNIPPALARSFNNYLLGVHVYDGNQPFLIVNVDSYEDAYAGMLKWEPFLEQNLSPLFDYTPSLHIPEQNVVTTAPASTTQLIQTGFTDSIVENHDARVLENSTGDIYLLWTFLDRNTLVITTNDATLREIIARLNEAPITPIPGPAAQ